jgi:hypothetical protein
MLGNGSKQTFKDPSGTVVSRDVWNLGTNEPNNYNMATETFTTKDETVAIFDKNARALADITETCSPSGTSWGCSAACQRSAPTGSLLIFQSLILLQTKIVLCHKKHGIWM